MSAQLSEKSQLSNNSSLSESESLDHPLQRVSAGSSLPPPAFQLKAEQESPQSESALQLQGGGDGFVGAIPPAGGPQQGLTPPVQRTIFKQSDVNHELVQDLKKSLIESGTMSPDVNSPRHQKFLEMLASKKVNYRDDMVQETLWSMDPDPEPVAATAHEQSAKVEVAAGSLESLQKELRQKFQAVPTRSKIILTGGVLSAYQVRQLKVALAKIPPAQRPVSNEELAKVLHENVELDLKPPVFEIHQQLDQEVEFAENVQIIASKLASVGAAPQVFRPSDDQLMLPAGVNKFISPDWKPFNSIAEIQPEPEKGNAKEILVTMGHGFKAGHTHFGHDGLLSQEAIGKHLHIHPQIGNAMLYVPLQCYPNAALRAGGGQKWATGGVHSEKTIT